MNYRVLLVIVLFLLGNICCSTTDKSSPPAGPPAADSSTEQSSANVAARRSTSDSAAAVAAATSSPRSISTNKGVMPQYGRADLQVKIIPPEQMWLRRNLRYDLKVRNCGQAASTTAQMIYELPAAMEFLEASDDGVYDAQKHQITWIVPPLAAGAEKLYNFHGRVLRAGKLSSRVRLTSGIQKIQTHRSSSSSRYVSPPVDKPSTTRTAALHSANHQSSAARTSSGPSASGAAVSRSTRSSTARPTVSAPAGQTAPASAAGYPAGAMDSHAADSSPPAAQLPPPQVRVLQDMVYTGEDIDYVITLSNKTGKLYHDVQLKLVLPEQVKFKRRQAPIYFNPRTGLFQAIKKFPSGRRVVVKIKVQAVKEGEALLKVMLQARELTKEYVVCATTQIIPKFGD